MLHANPFLSRHSLTAALLIGLSCPSAVAASPTAPAAKSPSANQAKLAQSYGKLPLSFEANQGQTDSSVQFLSHGQGYTLFLRSGEAVLVQRGASPNPPTGTRDQTMNKTHEFPSSEVRMQLVGAHPRALAAPEDPQITRTNYFLGNNPAKWLTDIPNYGRIRYRSIYDGIDLVY